MSKSTEYTCDRCGVKTVYGTTGWQLDVKSGSYSNSDYCPACVSQLLKLGNEAEKAAEKKPRTVAAPDIPF